MKSCLRVALLIVVVIAHCVRADIPDSLTAVFTQELDTRTWRLGGSLAASLDGWSVQSDVHSQLTQRYLRGFEQQWKNDLGLSIEAQRSIGERLEFLFEAEGQRFRDSESPMIVERGAVSILPDRNDAGMPRLRPVTGQNSLIERALFRGGIRFRHGRNFAVHILGGSAHDHQLGGRGDGPSLHGGFTWDLPEEQTGVDGIAWMNQYGDRRNHNAAIEAGIEQDFGDANDFLSVSWNNRRSELLIGSQGVVVRRVQDDVRVVNRLVTPVGVGFDGVYDLVFRSFNVDYEGGGLRQAREQDFSHKFSLIGTLPDRFVEIYYQYAIEDRDFIGNLILGRRQSIGLVTGFIHRRDSLTVRYSTEKLRFDSPDETEISDRDRLIHHAQLLGKIWVLPHTQLVLDASLYLDHLVYLESERSGDNRWNRVLRLSPAVEWHSASGLFNRAVFEVIANYTAYDFEGIGSGGTLRSTVLRRWSAADTLSIPLGSAWRSQLSGRYDLEDRGRLIWDEFAQELSGEKRTAFASCMVERLLWSYLAVQTGYRFQRRLEDRFDLDVEGSRSRSRMRTYVAAGPLFRIESLRWYRFNVVLEANILFINDNLSLSNDRLVTIHSSFAYLW